MTFEKIEPPAPAKSEVEHPAYRAAAMIRELHEQTIDLIDKGQVFTKDGVDVSAEIKARCMEQIIVCNDVMKRTATMDPKLWAQSLAILNDPEQVVAGEMGQLAKPGQQVTVVDGQMLPEIGDYDQT